MITVGIGLAFVAMLSWGFGDFMMQKSAKRLGDWETIFFIDLFGIAILLPFVWDKIPGLVFGDHAGLLILVLAIVSGAFILANPASRASIRALKANEALLIAMSIADNIGWIAYAVAMTLVPIAVATGMSESSIIIAVLLGLFVNKEKLQR